VAGLTKSLGAELGRHGIRCNGICPGYFMTEMAAASSYMNGQMLMIDGGVSEILSFPMSVV
jgi:gluconate 5-dehydrogenase